MCEIRSFPPDKLTHQPTDLPRLFLLLLGFFQMSGDHHTRFLEACYLYFPRKVFIALVTWFLRGPHVTWRVMWFNFYVDESTQLRKGFLPLRIWTDIKPPPCPHRQPLAKGTKYWVRKKMLFPPNDAAGVTAITVCSQACNRRISPNPSPSPSPASTIRTASFLDMKWEFFASPHLSEI